MNVAIVSYRFPPKAGGGEVVLGALATYLSNEKNNVYVVSNSAGPSVHNYTVLKTPSIGPDILCRILHIIIAPFLLFLVCISKDINVIQAGGLMDLFVTAPSKILLRKPVVLRMGIWNHATIAQRLRLIVGNIPDKIIVLTSVMQQGLAEGKIPQQKIVIIHNGVNPTAFFPTKKSSNQDKIVMIWCGRLDKHKNPSLAVKVLANLKRKHANVLLKIVGDGDEKVPLQTLVEKYNLTDSVEFLGHVDHSKIVQVLHEGDIFLMTSKGEGMSNALLEAMACGLVSIAPASSSIDVITNNYNGYIAENLEQMIRAIDDLISNPTLKKQIAYNTRNTIINDFRVEKTFSTYAQVYADVVGNK